MGLSTKSFGLGGRLLGRAEDKAERNAAAYNQIQRDVNIYLDQKPYFKQSLKDAQDIYQKGAKGEFSADTLEAVRRMKERAMKGSDLSRLSQSEMMKTLGGGYLNSNPYLDEAVNRAQRSSANTIQSAFASSGRYGSGAMGNAIGRASGEIGSQMYGNNYERERARMFEALPMAQQMALMDYEDIDKLREAGAYYDKGRQLDSYQNRIGTRTPQGINQVYTNKNRDRIALLMQLAGMTSKAVGKGASAGSGGGMGGNMGGY